MPSNVLFEVPKEHQAVLDAQREGRDLDDEPQAEPAPAPKPTTKSGGIQEADPDDFDDAAASDEAEDQSASADDDEEAGDDDTEERDDDADDAQSRGGGDLQVALRQERQRAREARKEAEDLRRVISHLTAGGQPMAQQPPVAQQPAAEAVEPPDPAGPTLEELPDVSEDLDGYLAGMARNQQRTADWVRQQQAHTAHVQSRQREVYEQQDAWDRYLGDSVQRYSQERPDWQDAVNHLVTVYADVTAASRAYSPAQARQVAVQALDTMARQAAVRHQDPAEVLYDMALQAKYQAAADSTPGTEGPPRRQKGQVKRRASREAQSEARLAGTRTAAPAPTELQRLSNAGIGEMLELARDTGAKPVQAAIRRAMEG